jgi:hypothetical protein
MAHREAMEKAGRTPICQTGRGNRGGTREKPSTRKSYQKQLIDRDAKCVWCVNASGEPKALAPGVTTDPQKACHACTASGQACRPVRRRCPFVERAVRVEFFFRGASRQQLTCLPRNGASMARNAVFTGRPREESSRQRGLFLGAVRTALLDHAADVTLWLSGSLEERFPRLMNSPLLDW